MSTLYIDTNPDLPTGFGVCDDEPEFHPLFSDEEIYAIEKRRDAEREEFERKANRHNSLLKKANNRMRSLKKIEL